MTERVLCGVPSHEPEHETVGNVSRRGFLQLAGGSTLLSAAPLIHIPKLLQAPKKPLLHGAKEHKITIYNTHTGEALKKCTFWADGEYCPDALRSLNKLFRDHRTGDVHPMDRDLLHLLHQITARLDTTQPFHLISGYRSARSNGMLRSRSHGVAKNSQHVYGRAADIAVPGRSLKQVQAAAKSLQAGGVGRYSQFVHVDTGRVRYWGAV